MEYLQLNLGYLAMYTPHLLLRFARLAAGASRVGECTVIDASIVGDVVVFHCDPPEVSAVEMRNLWIKDGVPKRALKILKKLPPALEVSDGE